MEIIVTEETSSQITSKLPWWTWVVPLPIFHLGTQLSVWSHVTTGTSLFYFPIAFALVLCCWWGLRVLPAFYLNATLSAGLWGLENPLLFPVYAFPETLFVFLFWVLFIRMAKGKCWLPNVSELISFLGLGMVIPLVMYKLLLEGIFVWADQLPVEQFWMITLTTTLGDFISLFGVTIPILYFATGSMSKWGLALIDGKVPQRAGRLGEVLRRKRTLLELTGLLLTIFVLSQTVDFTGYWFLFGIASLLSAMRFGFGINVIVNSFILLLTYVLPSARQHEFMEVMILGQETTRIQIGTGLLYVFSTITGRVISDAAYYQWQLKTQKAELETTNKELDRFVYSISHDLSAPLKSIRGLVTISRMERMTPQLATYLDYIESSANKLETFVSDILDYSRNERLPVSTETIDFVKLCDEILDNLKYTPMYDRVRVYKEIAVDSVVTDKLRLKIILTNLLSNAFKFQKIATEQELYVRIRSTTKDGMFIVEVEDNGEGINREHLNRIFDMFFRASVTSKGSGLGLYIVKESVERIRGQVSVSSTLGSGSKFTIQIPFGRLEDYN